MDEEYILSHISPEPRYLQELYKRTCRERLYPHMCSGHLQGRVLKMLTQMIKPRRVLEIGTYSGYSTLAIAEGLTEEGIIHTVEIDDEAEDWLREVFAGTPLGQRIVLHIGDAMELVPQLDEQWDMVLIDANKRDYVKYLDLVLPRVQKGGYILADNTLWGGKVSDPSKHDPQTRGVREFNRRVAMDPAFETVILPMRDGLSIIKKL